MTRLWQCANRKIEDSDRLGALSLVDGIEETEDNESFVLY